MKATLYIASLLLILVGQIGPLTVMAKSYYVDPASNAIGADGSLSNPWKTMDQVNQRSRSLLPGDTVFFKCGASFSGRLTIGASGTAERPIVFTSFGSGEKPEFTHSTTGVIVIQNRRYIVLDGLKIADKTMDATDHKIMAKIGYGIVLDNAPFCQIKNCEIVLVGIGISIYNGSDNTRIEENHIHNLRMIRNTPGGDDDFGANALVIGSSANQVTNNRFEQCWANSYDYGFDGGAIEFFGQNTSENRILYNMSIDNCGFLEVGSSSNGTCMNNTIGYNKIINNGYSGAFHTSAAFGTKISNMNYYNNVIIETKKQFAAPRKLFWISEPYAGIVNFRNNIVWLKSGISFATKTRDTVMLNHSNNLFSITTGGILGITANATEISKTILPLFTDTTGEPSNWNFQLIKGSPAIDGGVDVGLKNDFLGNFTVGRPDIGVYEFADGNAATDTSARKVTDSIHLTINLEKKSLIHVYPNPSSYQFTVNTTDFKNGPFDVVITLINQAGNIIFRERIRTDTPYYFGADLRSGWYSLIAEANHTIQTLQLIKL